MSQIYKSGKKVQPKKPTELRTIDISNAFVVQLERKLIEFVNGVRDIPEEQIPPELKTLLIQIQSDVYHFIDQFRMTQDSKKFEDGLIIKPGNKGYDEEFEVVKMLDSEYKTKNKTKKSMSYKQLEKSLNEINEKRSKVGEPLLNIIHPNTYNKWKKSFQ